MTRKAPIHTVPYGDGWANISEGTPHIIQAFGTKAAAQAAGRDRALADGVEHVVHDRDHSITRRTDYAPATSPAWFGKLSRIAIGGRQTLVHGRRS